MAKLRCQKSITLEPIDTKFDIVDYVCDTLQCVHVANYTDHLVEVSQQIYMYTVISYIFNFYGINFCLPHETRPLNHFLHILILVRPSAVIAFLLHQNGILKMFLLTHPPCTLICIVFSGPIEFVEPDLAGLLPISPPPDSGDKRESGGVTAANERAKKDGGGNYSLTST